jgi:DNA adenine methylase
MKTPISYYGGKQTLAKTILALIPEHWLYCEPFLGGTAVFFAKEPSKVEIINDSNGELMNFYQVVKQDFTALEREIAVTLHSRKQHDQAWVIYKNPEMFNPVKRTWAVWLLANASYGCMLNGGTAMSALAVRPRKWTTSGRASRLNTLKGFSASKSNVATRCQTHAQQRDAPHVDAPRDARHTPAERDAPHAVPDTRRHTTWCQRTTHGVRHASAVPDTRHAKRRTPRGARHTHSSERRGTRGA